MLRANGKEMHEAETGVGPVDALAKVLKKSLKSLFPVIDEVNWLISARESLIQVLEPLRVWKWKFYLATARMPGE